MFVINKDEAKAALRSGKVVYGDRQIGKTEALIEVIHEDHKGNAIVVTADPMHGDIFKSRYRERFPDDAVPRIEHPLTAGRGTNTPLYADCLGMCRVSDRRNLELRMAAAIW